MINIITKKSVGLIHKVFNSQLKNKKNYTASTKTRSEVKGGGRKPWKQKGTGQARAGSIRSSIWVGGGVSFGPKPHLVHKKINRKEGKLALYIALKLKHEDIIIVPDSFLTLNTHKTQILFKILASLNLVTYKNILLISNISKNLQIASANLKNITLSSVYNLNLQKIIAANKIVITEATYNLLNN